MHYLLFYDVAPDYLERRADDRSQHLAMAWAGTDASTPVHPDA